jgi:hypothetical protein
MTVTAGGFVASLYFSWRLPNPAAGKTSNRCRAFTGGTFIDRHSKGERRSVFRFAMCLQKQPDVGSEDSEKRSVHATDSTVQVQTRKTV